MCISHIYMWPMNIICIYHICMYIYHTYVCVYTHVIDKYNIYVVDEYYTNVINKYYTNVIDKYYIYVINEYYIYVVNEYCNSKILRDIIYYIFHSIKSSQKIL
jgi:hypothetical protein